MFPSSVPQHLQEKLMSNVMDCLERRALPSDLDQSIINEVVTFVSTHEHRPRSPSDCKNLADELHTPSVYTFVKESGKVYTPKLIQNSYTTQGRIFGLIMAWYTDDFFRSDEYITRLMRSGKGTRSLVKKPYVPSLPCPDSYDKVSKKRLKKLREAARRSINQESMEITQTYIYTNHVNWYQVSLDKNIVRDNDFVYKHRDLLDWDVLSRHELPDSFVETFMVFLKWNAISHSLQISSEMIRKYCKLIDWNRVQSSRIKQMPEELIIELKFKGMIQ